jgi:hypothetical protein
MVASSLNLNTFMGCIYIYILRLVEVTTLVVIVLEGKKFNDNPPPKSNKYPFTLVLLVITSLSTIF